MITFKLITECGTLFLKINWIELNICWAWRIKPHACWIGESWWRKKEKDGVLKVGIISIMKNTNQTIATYTSRYQYFNEKYMFDLESMVTSRNIKNQPAHVCLNSSEWRVHFSSQSCLLSQTTLKNENYPTES